MLTVKQLIRTLVFEQGIMGNSDKTGLGDRMKRYEEASRHILPRRMPIILRLDGKAFHTFTRKCDKPYDNNLSNAMLHTAGVLCDQIQGAEFAYTQSDEISILIHSYKRLNSESWFDNQLQKIVSVAAGIASATFTLEAIEHWRDYKPAVFDARAFVLPESEVCNYFIWRQQDAVRNSIQMLAQSLYSPKELHGKNTSVLQEMCHARGRNWNDIKSTFKRGACLTKVDSKWVSDTDIPIFSADRNYVEKHLVITKSDAIADWKSVSDEIDASVGKGSVTKSQFDRWMSSGWVPAKLAERLQALIVEEKE